MSQKSKRVQLYATTLLYIKQAIEDATESHANALPRLKALLELMEEEKISIEEMCRFSGNHAYAHNKYLMGVFYLTLAECHDPDICPEHADVRVAQRYYMMSDQPPAKWRLARIYLSEKVMCNGNPEAIAGKLIREAIHMLIDDEDYNQRYFEIRLNYLADMCEDLLKLTEDQKVNYELYFEILRWIINNQPNVRDEHQDTIYRFMEMDVPVQSNADNMTLDEMATVLG